MDDILLKFDIMNRICKICEERNISSDKYLSGQNGVEFMKDITFVCSHIDGDLNENIKKCLNFVDQYGMDAYLSKNTEKAYAHS